MPSHSQPKWRHRPPATPKTIKFVGTNEKTRQALGECSHAESGSQENGTLIYTADNRRRTMDDGMVVQAQTPKKRRGRSTTASAQDVSSIQSQSFHFIQPINFSPHHQSIDDIQSQSTPTISPSPARALQSRQSLDDHVYALLPMPDVMAVDSGDLGSVDVPPAEPSSPARPAVDPASASDCGVSPLSPRRSRTGRHGVVLKPRVARLAASRRPTVEATDTPRRLGFRTRGRGRKHRIVRAPNEFAGIERTALAKGTVFDATSRALIRNVVANIAGEHSSGVLYKASKALGVSRETVMRALDDMTDRRKERLSWKEKYGKAEQDTVRFSLHDMRRAGMHITMRNLTGYLATHKAGEIKVKRATLAKIVRSIGFVKKLKNSRWELYEDKKMVKMRLNFFAKLDYWRAQDYHVTYIDETWVWDEITTKSDWHDRRVMANPALPRLDPRYTHNPPAAKNKGKRILILAAMNEDQVFPPVYVFSSHKNNEPVPDDYHKEMTSEVFFDWFKKMLPGLPPRQAIMVDNAPYHRKLSYCPPNMKASKDEMLSFLREKKIPFPKTKITKVKLYKLYVQPNREKYKRYQIYDVLRESGRKDLALLWSVPYTCETMAIELLWAELKPLVAVHNTGRTVDSVIKLTKEKIDTLNATPGLLGKIVRATEKEEERLREFDRLIAEKEQQEAADRAMIDGDVHEQVSSDAPMADDDLGWVDDDVLADEMPVLDEQDSFELI